ncbi:MAG: hypothetical protein ABMA01_07925 [Chthoniobacteraceae bacterium]
MKNQLTPCRPGHRESTLTVRSVMPGSMIVPELRYSIPFTPGRRAVEAARSLDADSHRHGIRHAMSGQRI